MNEYTPILLVSAEPSAQADLSDMPAERALNDILSSYGPPLTESPHEMGRYRYELARGGLRAVADVWAPADVWATADGRVEAVRILPLRPGGKRSDRAATAA